MCYKGRGRAAAKKEIPVRITGGQWRGRILKVPRRGVRPTQDRVREAIGSSLGARLAGARVLDLFAGSGALGLEALSRGAAHACWVEKDHRTLQVLRENLAALAPPPGSARVVSGDVWGFLRQDTDAPYDLVFADPPYGRAPAPGDNPGDNLLPALARSRIVAPGALLVREQPLHAEAVETGAWRLLSVRRYGATRVVYYQRKTS